MNQVLFLYPNPKYEVALQLILRQPEIESANFTTFSSRLLASSSDKIICLVYMCVYCVYNKQDLIQFEIRIVNNGARDIHLRFRQ